MICHAAMSDKILNILKSDMGLNLDISSHSSV
jgi:hypothetical protein